nr:EOG090X05NZ [Sida crystallina]
MVFFNVFKASSKLCCNVVVVAGTKAPTALPATSTQIRAISSKTMRHRNPTARPAPFPYKTERYNFFRALFDVTTDRLDENSKLIVVDGPPAAGKAALAKELAEELDMLYLRAPTMDDRYINSYGYDMRQLDSQLPKSCKSYDEKDFLKNPTDIKGSRLQIWKMTMRYRQHLNALAHILNTGQGVVMDRSPFSDFVYTESMNEHGLCAKNFVKYYEKLMSNTMFHLWRPHLVIYLDVPVSEVRRRIETRNRPYEKDSLVTTPEYLQTLENLYKRKYLKTISEHAEVLVYDWTEPAEVEIVVEDVERVDFDQYGIYDLKMKDWRRLDKWDWNNHRHKFTHQQDKLLSMFLMPSFDTCPELMIDGEDNKIFERVWFDAPGNKYAEGFNEDMNDGSVLLKLK